METTEDKTQEKNLNDAEEQRQRQPYTKKRLSGIIPYRFKKGQSGNPGGRPKGLSMKVWVRNRLMEMDDDDRIEFLKEISPLDIWKMAEGNPDTPALDDVPEEKPFGSAFLDKDGNLLVSKQMAEAIEAAERDRQQEDRPKNSVG